MQNGAAYLHYTLHTCAIVINFAHMHAVYIYTCMPSIPGQLVSFIQDCYLGQAENTLQETASTFLIRTLVSFPKSVMSNQIIRNYDIAQ